MAKRKTRIEIRVPKEVREELDKLAESKGITRNATIQLILMEVLEQWKPPDKSLIRKMFRRKWGNKHRKGGNGS